jgi:hypothetical protein
VRSLDPAKMSFITRFSLDEVLEIQSKMQNREFEVIDSKLIENQGKQSLTKLVTILLKDRRKIKAIYKVSQYYDYTIRKEYDTMRDLQILRSYCPYFACPLLFEIRKEKIPTPEEMELINEEIITDDDISEREREVLYIEYVGDHNNPNNELQDLLSDNKYTDDELISIVKEILIAILFGEQERRLCHYDIHNGNVILNSISKNSVILHVLSDDLAFLIPSNGYVISLIDFTLSYSENLNATNFFGTLNQTNVGYDPTSFDPLFDARLLLTNVKNNINSERSMHKPFSKFVETVFKNHKYDRLRGWNTFDIEYVTKIVGDEISRICDKINHRKSIFFKDSDYCADLLFPLITYPLDSNIPEIDMTTPINIIVSEFEILIDGFSNNEDLQLYLLKFIVLKAIKTIDRYINKNTRYIAVREFNDVLFQFLRTEVPFYQIPSAFSCEKLLCGLAGLSACLESIVVRELKEVSNLKKLDKIKSDNRFPNTQSILIELMNLFPQQITFNPQTVIYVFNAVNKTSSIKTGLSKKQCTLLNRDNTPNVIKALLSM